MVGFKIGKLCQVQQVTHSTTRSPRRQDLELTETEWQQTNSTVIYYFMFSNIRLGRVIRIFYCITRNPNRLFGSS